MTPNKKLEIQNIVEKILAKYNIDPSAESYFLKLSKPHYDDLVIERRLPGSCGPLLSSKWGFD